MLKIWICWPKNVNVINPTRSTYHLGHLGTVFTTQVILGMIYEIGPHIARNMIRFIGCRCSDRMNVGHHTRRDLHFSKRHFFGEFQRALFLAMADAGPKVLGILPSLWHPPIDQMSIKSRGKMGNFGAPQFEKHPETFWDYWPWWKCCINTWWILESWWNVMNRRCWASSFP